MGLLDRLFGRSPEERVLRLHVRFDNCGAKVRVRVNLHHDLGLADEGGYILRKQILDSQCCQPMHPELRFDGRKRVTSRHISGGEFITKTEYEADDGG